jgi:hypothetical protein
MATIERHHERAGAQPWGVPRISVATAGLAALALVLAGVAFFLYPLLRPFSDETTLAGARAFASGGWVLAHALAVGGFISLALGWLGLHELLRATDGRRAAAIALVLGWIGIGLTLPYYGAEVFGLHAVGQGAVSRGDATLLSITDSIRWEQGLWFILSGLLLAGVAGVFFAVAQWRARTVGRWGGVVLAVALALYIPQFAAPQPLRIAHGALVLLGCWMLARSVLRRASGM